MHGDHHLGEVLGSMEEIDDLRARVAIGHRRTIHPIERAVHLRDSLRLELLGYAQEP